MRGNGILRRLAAGGMSLALLLGCVPLGALAREEDVVDGVFSQQIEDATDPADESTSIYSGVLPTEEETQKESDQVRNLVVLSSTGEDEDQEEWEDQSGIATYAGRIGVWLWNQEITNDDIGWGLETGVTFTLISTGENGDYSADNKYHTYSLGDVLKHKYVTTKHESFYGIASGKRGGINVYGNGEWWDDHGKGNPRWLLADGTEVLSEVIRTSEENIVVGRIVSVGFAHLDEDTGTPDTGWEYKEFVIPYAPDTRYPVIYSQPKDVKDAVIDTTYTFTVGATGSNLEYDWYVANPGAYNADEVSLDYEGDTYDGYWFSCTGLKTKKLKVVAYQYRDDPIEVYCRVKNEDGTAISNTAYLNLGEPSNGHWNRNLTNARLRMEWVGDPTFESNPYFEFSSLRQSGDYGDESYRAIYGYHDKNVSVKQGENSITGEPNYEVKDYSAGYDPTRPCVALTNGGSIKYSVWGKVSFNSGGSDGKDEEYWRGNVRLYTVNGKVYDISYSDKYLDRTVPIDEGDVPLYVVATQLVHWIAGGEGCWEVFQVYINFTVEETAIPAPEITSNPSDQGSFLNTATTFTVGASGDELEYEWQVCSPTSSTWTAVSDVSGVLTVSGQGTNSLTVTPLSSSANAYWFRCVVSNPAGSVESEKGILTVYPAPTIQSSPTTAAIYIGQSTTFSASASGQSVSYQWQMNSGSGWTTAATDTNVTISGATGTTLTVKANTAAAKGYQFRMVATNPSGSATSNAASLTVHPVPTVTSQPGSAGIYQGGTAKFVAAGTSTGGVSYEWQMYNGSAWVTAATVSGTMTISGATGTTLSVTDQAQNANGRQFRCRIYNASGSVYTNTVTLTVYPAPVISSHPAGQAIFINGSATFTVGASHQGSGTLRYTWWMHNGTSWVTAATDAKVQLSGLGTASLTVKALSYGANGYKFLCYVANDSGQVESNPATLTVYNVPSVTNPNTPFEVYVNQTATFTISASGQSIQSYQWYMVPKGGSATAAVSDSNVTISGATSATLKVTAKSTAADGYTFYCKVTNPSGSTNSGTGYLAVYETPTISGAQTIYFKSPSSTTSGYVATYIATAKGAGLSYQWQMKSSGGSWTNATTVSGVLTVSGQTSKTLTVTAQSYSANGYSFRCVVTNAAGAVYTGESGLKVYAAPTVTNPSAPGGIYVNDSYQATFSVTATGENLSYQWQMNSGSGWVTAATDANVNIVSGANSNTLTVKAKTASGNGYQFRCVVSNGSGTATSAGAKLTVYDKPTVTDPNTPFEIYVNQTATFNVTGSGTGFSYRWWMCPKGGTWVVAASDSNVTISGETTATLKVTAKSTAADGYYFLCRVENPTGYQDSKYAYLAVYKTPTISGDQAIYYKTPSSTADGYKATYTVTAEGAGLSYQWKMKSPGGSWTNAATVSGVLTVVSGQNGNVLTVTAQSDSANGYSFYCVVTNAAGPVDTGASSLTVYPKPTVTANPVDSVIFETYTTHFAVEATGEGRSYQWKMKSPGGQWVNAAAVDGVMSVSGADSAKLSVEAKTTGATEYQFKCVVTNLSGAVESTPATLTVLALPKVTWSSGDTLGYVTKSTSMSIKASGGGTLSYQWQYRKNADDAWKNVADIAKVIEYKTESGDFESKLTMYLLINAQKEANGFEYRCVVTATVNSFSEQAESPVMTLKVEDIKPVWNVRASELRVSEDLDDAVFTGSLSEGTNITDLSWYYVTETGPVKITADNSAFTVENDLEAKTTKLTMHKESVKVSWNEVEFYCVATNTTGSVSSGKTRMYVRSIPGLPLMSALPIDGGLWSFWSDDNHVSNTDVDVTIKVSEAGAPVGGEVLQYQIIGPYDSYEEAEKAELGSTWTEGTIPSTVLRISEVGAYKVYARAVNDEDRRLESEPVSYVLAIWDSYPTIEQFTVSPTTWTNKPVTLWAKAGGYGQNTYRGFYYTQSTERPLPNNNATSDTTDRGWQDIEDQDTSTAYEIESPGMWYVWARNSIGTVTPEGYQGTVEAKIDMAAPNIKATSYSGSLIYSVNGVLQIEVEDTGTHASDDTYLSGLYAYQLLWGTRKVESVNANDPYWIRFNNAPELNGAKAGSVSELITLPVAGPGNYTLFLMDVAGNISATVVDVRMDVRTSVSLDIVDTTDPEFSTAMLEETIQGLMRLQFTSVKVTGQDNVSLVMPETIRENYSSYGTANANNTLGLELITNDGDVPLYRGSFGASNPRHIQGIRLYNAAAYNMTSDQTFDIYLENGNGDKARITVTVNAIKGKRLILDVPMGSADISLQPGISTEATSTPVTMKNSNAYPLTVNLGEVTQTNGTTLVVRKQLQTSIAGELVELMTAGVKLGVKVGLDGEPVYYDPNTAMPVTDLASGRQKQLFYILEYSPLYLGTGDSFTYKIGYDVSIPQYDVSNT